jgi:hypothetical protein
MINPGHATWWHNPSPNLRGKCTADMELWGPWVFDKKDMLTLYGIFPKCLFFLSSDIIIMWAQFPSHALFPGAQNSSATHLFLAQFALAEALLLYRDGIVLWWPS